MVFNNGTVDKGFKTPKIGYNIFINNPENNKKETLKLTESENIFMILLSLILKTWIIKNPGMNVR